MAGEGGFDIGMLVGAGALGLGGYMLLTGKNPLAPLGINTDLTIDPLVAQAANSAMQSQAAYDQQRQTTGSGRAAIGLVSGGAGTAAGIAGAAGLAAST